MVGRGKSHVIELAAIYSLTFYRYLDKISGMSRCNTIFAGLEKHSATGRCSYCLFEHPCPLFGNKPLKDMKALGAYSIPDMAKTLINLCGCGTPEKLFLALYTVTEHLERLNKKQ